MSVPPQLRECSWTGSGDPSGSSDEENNPHNNLGILSIPQPRPRARRGPIIPFDSEELGNSREF